MKNVGLWIVIVLLTAWGVQAQEKDKEPEALQIPEMPTFHPPSDVHPMPTPNKDISSFGINQQSGEPTYYLDPKSKLYFDFQQREIRDFNTGETYSFDEFSQRLRKKKPEPERKKEVVTL
jgi:hypothetical protein